MSMIRCRCMPQRPWRDAEDEAFWEGLHAYHVRIIEALDRLIRDRAEAQARADAEWAERLRRFRRSPLLLGVTEEEIEAELADAGEFASWRAEGDAQE